MDPDLIGEWQGTTGRFALDPAGWSYGLFDHMFQIDPTGTTLALTLVGGATTTYARQFGAGPVLFGLWRYGPDANGEEIDLAFLTPDRFYEVTSFDGIVDTLESGHFDTAGGSGGNIVMRKRRAKATTDNAGGIFFEVLGVGGVDQTGSYGLSADKNTLTLTLNGQTRTYQRV